MKGGDDLGRRSKGDTMNKKEKIKAVKAGALLTSKPHKVLLNKAPTDHFSCNAFASFLLDIVPKGWDVTVVDNTTGKGKTLKVWNEAAHLVERVFFPSPTYKYQGYGVGEPQVRSMTDVLMIPRDELMQVRQGKKSYWFNQDFEVLHTYFVAKYADKSE